MNRVKTYKALVLLLVCGIVSRKTFAQLNNQHKNYIEIGFVGGQQNSNSALGGVYGCAGFFFKAFGRPASLDFRAKEMYITNPEQQGTLISLTYRISLVKGLFFGIGGAHGHQIDFDEFLVHPGSAIGGNNTHIMHSSGFNTEIGYNFNSFIKDKNIGIYPTVNLAYTHLFMVNHSMPNLTLNAGFRLGFKKFQ